MSIRISSRGQRDALAAILAGLCLVLIACGGDGRGAAAPLTGPPPPPATPAAPTVAYAVKAFEFSWPAVSGATRYRLGEDPTVSGNFTLLVDNIATTTHAVRDLSLAQPPVAWRYALQACNAGGCSAWSLPVSPDPTRAIGYFKSSNAIDTGFGEHLAFSPDGNTLAVASASLLNLFSRSANQWVWLQTLPFDASAPAPSLAADGTLLVGSSGVDGASTDQGQVQVFVRTPGGWTLTDTWNPPTPISNGRFGNAVDISHNGLVAVVSEDGEASPGKFHVYRRSGAAWSLEQTVQPNMPRPSGRFGWRARLSADGSTIVVGSPFEDSGSTSDETNTSTSDAGAAFIYGYDAGTGLWTRRAYLKAPAPSVNDWFGTTTAISADGAMVVIGARRRPVAGQANAGAAYVFRRNAGTYALSQTLTSPQPKDNGVFAGFDMALTPDGSMLVIGEIGDASASVGVGGSPIPAGLNNAGAAHLYRLGGAAFSYAAYLKASNTGAIDGFGHSVAVAPDGRTIAVGARNESSAATGIGGDQTNESMPLAGAVYLY